MNTLDIAILTVIGISLITGLFRGFVKELIALCVWILAFWLGYHYATTAAGVLPLPVSDTKIRTAIGFIVILLGTLVIGGVVNGILGFIVTRTGLSATDRLLGVGFGVLRGCVIVSVLFLGAQTMKVPLTAYTEHSILYAAFEPMVHWLQGYMPNVMKQLDQLSGVEKATA
jgi:membrane protein required for colicin V production